MKKIYITFANDSMSLFDEEDIAMWEKIKNGFSEEKKQEFEMLKIKMRNYADTDVMKDVIVFVTREVDNYNKSLLQLEETGGIIYEERITLKSGEDIIKPFNEISNLPKERDCIFYENKMLLGSILLELKSGEERQKRKKIQDVVNKILKDERIRKVILQELDKENPLDLWWKKFGFLTQYISQSIRYAYCSELLIPDVFWGLVMNMVAMQNSKEKFKEMGESYEDSEMVSHIKSYNSEVRTLGKYLNLTDAGEDSKGSKGVSFYVNHHFRPFIEKILYSNLKELKKIFFEPVVQTEQKKRRLVDELLKKINDYWDEYWSKRENEEFYGNDNFYEKEWDKVISDMIVNRIIGHRYTIDLVYTIMNLEERKSKYLAKWPQKENLEKEFQLVSPSKKEGEDIILTYGFIDYCLQLACYWQPAFWDMVQVFFSIFLEELRMEIYRFENDEDICDVLKEKIKNNRKVIDRNLKINGGEYFQFLGECLKENFDIWHIQKNFIQDKVRILEYVLDQHLYSKRTGDAKEELREKLIYQTLGLDTNSFASKKVGQIWQDMVNSFYYKEKERGTGECKNKVQKQFENADKDINNKEMQRKSGFLYNKIISEYLWRY